MAFIIIVIYKLINHVNYYPALIFYISYLIFVRIMAFTLGTILLQQKVHLLPQLMYLFINVT